MNGKNTINHMAGTFSAVSNQIIDITE